MTLGNIVKNYREASNLSQRQFAVMCGLSNGYISMLESNVNPKTGVPMAPSLLAIKKIADAMCMPLNDLLNQADDMPVGLQAADGDAFENKKPTAIEDGGQAKGFNELFELLSADRQALILQAIKELLSDQ